MSEQFTINSQLGANLRGFFYSRLFRTPSYPTQSFAKQTIIVTGANSGLGLEAARHFYRLNSAKLILAVRTISKGHIAKEDIVAGVKHRTDADAIEVWPLDLASTESTLDFAERVKKELPRLDALVENAGIHNKEWSTSEGFEDTIQVNVLNTFLLAFSLLPKLRETKTHFPDSSPHLVVMSSEAHKLTKFKEINPLDIYQTFNDKNAEKKFNGQGRYEVSKLLEVLLVRELVSRINASKSPSPHVTITLVNPGLCNTGLARDPKENSLAIRLTGALVLFLIGRTAEVGGRTLVLGAAAGEESHGEYMSDGENQEVEKWIYRDVGRKAQQKVWEQTMGVLEERSPGLAKKVGI